MSDSLGNMRSWSRCHALQLTLVAGCMEAVNQAVVNLEVGSCRHDISALKCAQRINN